MKNALIVILIIACIASIILGFTGQFKLIDEKEEIQKVNSLFVEHTKIGMLTNVDKRIEIGKKQIEISEKRLDLTNKSISFSLEAIE